MKKLSLLVALALLITVSGVYATWTYTQTTDVADESVHMSLNLTNVTYEGSYGTYEINKSGLSMLIDPKEGTTHTTALNITGNLVIKFTPATYAPVEVKNDGVASIFRFSLTNNDWKYGSTDIVTLQHTGDHAITWTKQADGSFTYTMDAAALAGHIKLNEVTLDTKAEYDAYNTALGTGQIAVTVSDGMVLAP